METRDPYQILKDMTKNEALNTEEIQGQKGEVKFCCLKNFPCWVISLPILILFSIMTYSLY